MIKVLMCLLAVIVVTTYPLWYVAYIVLLIGTFYAAIKICEAGK